VETRQLAKGILDDHVEVLALLGLAHRAAEVEVLGGLYRGRRITAARLLEVRLA
jgi:UV DNA damage repair endonuclease